MNEILIQNSSFQGKKMLKYENASNIRKTIAPIIILGQGFFVPVIFRRISQKKLQCKMVSHKK